MILHPKALEAAVEAVQTATISPKHAHMDYRDGLKFLTLAAITTYFDTLEKEGLSARGYVSSCGVVVDDDWRDKGEVYPSCVFFEDVDWPSDMSSVTIIRKVQP